MPLVIVFFVNSSLSVVEVSLSRSVDNLLPGLKHVVSCVLIAASSGSSDPVGLDGVSYLNSDIEVLLRRIIAILSSSLAVLILPSRSDLRPNVGVNVIDAELLLS